MKISFSQSFGYWHGIRAYNYRPSSSRWIPSELDISLGLNGPSFLSCTKVDVNYFPRGDFVFTLDHGLTNLFLSLIIINVLTTLGSA